MAAMLSKSDGVTHPSCVIPLLLLAVAFEAMSWIPAMPVPSCSAAASQHADGHGWQSMYSFDIPKGLVWFNLNLLDGMYMWEVQRCYSSLECMYWL